MAHRIKRRSELIPHVGRMDVAQHRAPSHALIYDSAWQHVARQRRHEDCYLCQVCLQLDRLTPSSDVDHIIPIHVRPDWRLDFDNTQVTCRSHHRKKTTADARTYGSSTAPTLTPAQHEARRAAQQLAHAPRTDPGGRLKPVDVSAKTVSPPTCAPPQYWNPGGST